MGNETENLNELLQTLKVYVDKTADRFKTLEKAIEVVNLLSSKEHPTEINISVEINNIIRGLKGLSTKMETIINELRNTEDNSRPE